MAGADYQDCELCSCRTFYDGNINYEGTNLGELKTLCIECAATHTLVLTKRKPRRKPQADTTKTKVNKGYV
jgi:hypothetical protein